MAVAPLSGAPRSQPRATLPNYIIIVELHDAQGGNADFLAGQELQETLLTTNGSSFHQRLFPSSKLPDGTCQPVHALHCDVVQLEKVPDVERHGFHFHMIFSNEKLLNDFTKGYQNHTHINIINTPLCDSDIRDCVTNQVAKFIIKQFEDHDAWHLMTAQASAR
jgi:hypothetical protein